MGCLVTAFLWGIFCIIFANPIGFGAAVSAGILLSIALVTMHLASLTPAMIGDAAKCVDQKMLDEAAVAAKAWFKRRRSLMVPISKKWREHDRRERLERAMMDRYAEKKTHDDDEDQQEEGRTTAREAADSIRNLRLGMLYEDVDAMYRKEK